MKKSISPSNYSIVQNFCPKFIIKIKCVFKTLKYVQDKRFIDLIQILVVPVTKMDINMIEPNFFKNNNENIQDILK